MPGCQKDIGCLIARPLYGSLLNSNVCFLAFKALRINKYLSKPQQKLTNIPFSGVSRVPGGSVASSRLGELAFGI